MEPLPNQREPAGLLIQGINTAQPHSSALWTHGPHWLPFESHVHIGNPHRSYP